MADAARIHPPAGCRLRAAAAMDYHASGGGADGAGVFREPDGENQR
jgi:hypothetical protein